MNILNRLLLSTLAALLLVPGANAARMRDDLGRIVTLNMPARRIVSMAPSVTENLFAIGAGKKIVGVIAPDDHPGVRNVTRVGDFYRPSIERIRALKPDVVLIDSATADAAAMELLESRLKAPVYVQRSLHFGDVTRHLDQLGKIAGAQAGAKKTIGEIQQKVAKAKRIAAGKPRVRVFVEINAAPLYAAGPGSFVDDLISLAGAKNVVTKGAPFPMYSKEAVIAADPDFYIIAQGGEMGRSAPHTRLQPPLNRLRAVRTRRVREIDADILLRPTPRMADGLVALAKALHGA